MHIQLCQICKWSMIIWEILFAWSHRCYKLRWIKGIILVVRIRFVVEQARTHAPCRQYCWVFNYLHAIILDMVHIVGSFSCVFEHITWTWKPSIYFLRSHIIHVFEGNHTKLQHLRHWARLSLFESSVNVLLLFWYGLLPIHVNIPRFWYTIQLTNKNRVCKIRSWHIIYLPLGSWKFP